MLQQCPHFHCPNLEDLQISNKKKKTKNLSLCVCELKLMFLVPRFLLSTVHTVVLCFFWEGSGVQLSYGSPAPQDKSNKFLKLDRVHRYHWDWISFQKWKVPRTIEWRREGTSQLRRVMMHNTILHNQRNQNYPVQPGIFSIQLLNIPSQIMTSFFFFFF